MAFEIVRECLIDALVLDETEAESIQRHTTAADLRKWDSLGHFVLISQLEERFAIQFDDEETVQLGSVEAIMRAVTNKQQ